MSNNWIYIGVFLTNNVKEALKKQLEILSIDIPEGWKTYLDHMTLCFNMHDEQSERLYTIYNNFFGKTVNLKCTSVGIADDIMAFGIDTNLITQNKQPHITIAAMPGTKPVKSNDIEKWIPIDNIIIEGVINEFIYKR